MISCGSISTLKFVVSLETSFWLRIPLCWRSYARLATGSPCGDLDWDNEYFLAPGSRREERKHCNRIIRRRHAMKQEFDSENVLWSICSHVSRRQAEDVMCGNMTKSEADATINMTNGFSWRITCVMLDNTPEHRIWLPISSLIFWCALPVGKPGKG
jgi:hypothetical protein